MLLEKNGIMSSSKRTKHINVRYYFIKDRIDKGEINVIYCPTEMMIADYFTKPLQGLLFIRFMEAMKERVDENSILCTKSTVPVQWKIIRMCKRVETWNSGSNKNYECR